MQQREDDLKELRLVGEQQRDLTHALLHEKDIVEVLERKLAVERQLREMALATMQSFKNALATSEAVQCMTDDLIRSANAERREDIQSDKAIQNAKKMHAEKLALARHALESWDDNLKDVGTTSRRMDAEYKQLLQTRNVRIFEKSLQSLEQAKSTGQ